ncbi:DNA-3-methyladenine glycosylase 2 family protein [Veillonella atypica]|nr:DNA-3-methyladenine glycosylase 2 family protein [Veillonella atypica]
MATQIELTENSPPIQHLCKKDKRLAKVISMVGPITYTVHEDGFDFLFHEIIEQMLSIKAGAKIYERLVKLCNGQITPEQFDSLTDDDIKSIGTSKSKVSYIRTVTNEVLSKNLVRDELQDLSNEEVYKKLLALRGIGKWTAKMYLIFVLNRQDILPYEDVAFLQSYEWLYKTKEKIKRINRKEM